MLSAETPTAFEHSGHEGWGYFQNAVDLVIQLVYKPTSVMVVQVRALLLFRCIPLLTRIYRPLLLW